MKGKHRIIISNNKLHYEFEVKRNITIIQGDSATGKTTLINMIRQYTNLGISSGIEMHCDVPCRVLEGEFWKVILASLSNNILFVDEENAFLSTEEFASAVKNSDNYFVLITRENLYNLPYSVEEIYGLHVSGKYQMARKVYQEMYHIYPNVEEFPIKPEKIIVEDSNSGYEFFKTVCEKHHIECESSGGKSNILKILDSTDNREICIIADGAAIGPEMNRLYRFAKKQRNVKLFLPESFEWIVLNSGLIEENTVKFVLKNPENYIDSKRFFSWERFFTDFLMKKTEGTYLQYKKTELNPAYLHERTKKKILESMHGIKWR